MYIEIRHEGQGVSFVTKGDNNRLPDPTWDAARLEGKLVAVIPKVGWVPMGLKLLIDRFS